MGDIKLSKNIEYDFSFSADVGMMDNNIQSNADSEGSSSSQSNNNIVRRFNGIAYSGKLATKYGENYVFDLSTVSIPEKLPVLSEHDVDDIIGIATKFEVTNQIKVEGYIFSNTEEGQKIALISDTAKSVGTAFPWQMSICIVPNNVMYLDEKTSTTVNGELVTGPCYVYKDSTIREISFTAIAADKNTSANLFSNQKNKDATTMPTEQEFLALKSQLETITAERNQFEAALTQFNQQIPALEEEVNSYKKTLLQNSFNAIGKPITEEKMQVFLKMPLEQFSAVLSEFNEITREIKQVTQAQNANGPAQSQTAAKSLLFSQMIQPPTSTTEPKSAENPLLKYAKQFSKN